MKKTKTEKRQDIVRKKEIKKKKGGTLAGQISRLATNNFYSREKTNK